MPVSEQSKTLSQKLRGHYSYYGVTGNGRALENLYDEVKRIWHKWLGRRSNRPLNWDRMLAILKAFPLRSLAANWEQPWHLVGWHCFVNLRGPSALLRAGACTLALRAFWGAIHDPRTIRMRWQRTGSTPHCFLLALASWLSESLL